MTVILATSRFAANNNQNVFSFVASGWSPLMLDFEVICGPPKPNPFMFLNFFLDGIKINSGWFRRYLSNAPVVPDRRMFMLPVIVSPFPINHILTIESADHPPDVY